MEAKNFYSYDSLNDLLAQAESVIANPQNFDLPLEAYEVMTDKDVARFLGVDLRTVRKYRKANLFRHFRIQGRVYYIKLCFKMDLISLFNEQNRR